MENITQTKSKLIKFFLFFLLGQLLLSFSSCKGLSSSPDADKKESQQSQVVPTAPKTHPLAHLDHNPIGKIALPSGHLLTVRLAITHPEQKQGLSGIAAENFADTDALLFFYREDSFRQFWMPNTYFDLDILFLDKDLRIVDIEKKVPHHPGMNVPPAIATTKAVYCRHVLEIKSSSPLASSLEKGMKLIWISDLSLSQIESKIRWEQ